MERPRRMHVRPQAPFLRVVPHGESLRATLLLGYPPSGGIGRAGSGPLNETRNLPRVIDGGSAAAPAVLRPCFPTHRSGELYMKYRAAARSILRLDLSRIPRWPSRVDCWNRGPALAWPRQQPPNAPVKMRARTATHSCAWIDRSGGLGSGECCPLIQWRALPQH